MKTETIISKIQTASNMVEIEHLLSEVTGHYLDEFAMNYRKFNRSKESQGTWINAAISQYKNEIAFDRLAAFGAIPPRFHRTEIYKRLQSQFN